MNQNQAAVLALHERMPVYGFGTGLPKRKGAVMESLIMIYYA
jgi:hypothetical protein